MAESASEYIPERPTLPRLREAAAGCRGCHLYRGATQTVFGERGKRRIHQTPRKGEIDACPPWLDTEIKLVRPTAVVALGATAAKALFGSQFRLTRHRGELIESDLAPVATATIHPAAIVRQRDAEAREREREAFADDLRVVLAQLDQSS